VASRKPARRLCSAMLKVAWCSNKLQDWRMRSQGRSIKSHDVLEAGWWKQPGLLMVWSCDAESYMLGQVL
jgi:hypothetical protein